MPPRGSDQTHTSPAGSEGSQCIGSIPGSSQSTFPWDGAASGTNPGTGALHQRWKAGRDEHPGELGETQGPVIPRATERLIRGALLASVPGTGATAKRRFRKAREGEPGAGRRQRAPVFAEIHLHRAVQCSQGRAAALNSKSRLGLSWNDQNIRINSRGSWKCGSDVQGLQSIRSFSTWDVTLDWDPLAAPQGWGGLRNKHWRGVH